MLVADVNIKDDMIVINIPTSKNGCKNGSSRKFVVMQVLWMEIVKKYLKMRSTPDMPRLFISIRNGKATRQNIGHNTIGEMPKKIAIYLNLPNPRSYTGHCFRRTSATILAPRGGNTLQLKQHGGWRSSNVVEGYVQDSLSIKKKIAQMVQGSSTSNQLS
jgi:integrase